MAQWLERRTCDRGVLGSKAAGSDGTSLRNFDSSVCPTLQCLSEETLKLFQGIFYLACMPGEVNDHTHNGNLFNLTCRGLHHSY